GCGNTLGSRVDLRAGVAGKGAEAAIGRVRKGGSAGERVARRKDPGGEASDEAVVDAGVATFPSVPATAVKRESIERTGSGLRSDEDRQRRGRASMAADFDSQQLQARLSAPRRVPDFNRTSEADQTAIRRVGEDARR